MTTTVRITLASIPVDDQAKALSFYCEKLGFERAQDIPMGEYRWIISGLRRRIVGRAPSRAQDSR